MHEENRNIFKASNKCVSTKNEVAHLTNGHNQALCTYHTTKDQDKKFMLPGQSYGYIIFIVDKLNIMLATNDIFMKAKNHLYNIFISLFYQKIINAYNILIPKCDDKEKKI